MINKKKRALLVMPLLVIPFLTMAFWAMGGGKGEAQSKGKPSGLNLQLPNAKLKDDKGENKLSFYEEAERDSEKLEEKTKNDPFSEGNPDRDTGLFSLLHPLGSSSSKFPSAFLQPDHSGDPKDPNEEKVYQKLRELQSSLNDNGMAKPMGLTQPSSRQYGDGGASEANRLEGLLKKGADDTSADPQVKELSQMMDKILEIQHPERMKNRAVEETSVIGQLVFTVRPNDNAYTISVLDTSHSGEQENSFFGIDVGASTAGQNAIEAVVHQTQNLVEGSIVKLRLSTDVSIGGVVIPKGSFVFGNASLQGERLNIDIHSIRKDQSLFPVQLHVYDLNGMEGIHIPGAVSRDVAKQSADRSLQGIEMSSIDPSLKAQATTAGINAAKTLLTKKVKLVSVTVKDGYRVLLK